MKPWLPLFVLAASGLTACDKAEFADGTASHRPGRYAGIGTYPAGEMWAQMTRKDATTDPKAATLADDEQIIAVIDSRTGEIRQCGNLSGVCISMKPWAETNARPVQLLKHAAELSAERDKNVEVTMEPSTPVIGSDANNKQR